MDLKRILGLLLPEGLEEYYDLVDIEEHKDKYVLHLDEKNTPPHYIDKSQKIVSKGFFEAKTIQDFNLRGQPTFLRIRRRKWMVQETGAIIHKDWKIAQEGTRMTRELAAFLKEVDRRYAH